MRSRRRPEPQLARRAWAVAAARFLPPQWAPAQCARAVSVPGKAGRGAAAGEILERIGHGGSGGDGGPGRGRACASARRCEAGRGDGEGPSLRRGAALHGPPVHRRGGVRHGLVSGCPAPRARPGHSGRLPPGRLLVTDPPPRARALVPTNTGPATEIPPLWFRAALRPPPHPGHAGRASAAAPTDTRSGPRQPQRRAPALPCPVPVALPAPPGDWLSQLTPPPPCPCSPRSLFAPRCPASGWGCASGSPGGGLAGRLYRLRGRDFLLW